MGLQGASNGLPSYDLNVMIASPSDVAAERALIREIVHEWNAVHAFTRRVVLQPVGWETHSTPSMGGHPQHILNEQVLAKCDLLVGVFWTRVGTKTPTHESGSVEEIEKHIAAGKPVMLYFSNSPVHPDSVDNAQYQRLQAFKASCQARGLYASYDGLTEFRDHFYRHLQLKINEDSFFTVSGGPTPCQRRFKFDPPRLKSAEVILTHRAPVIESWPP